MGLSQKTISLPENLYNRLKAKKKPGENFPDVIARLLDQEEHHQKPPITKFFGILGDDSEEWDKIEDGIYKNRLRKSDRDEIKFEDE
jgi:predicted CopG family antitoxin